MLLKKANTITTPTAYSNGFLHSVKPEVVLGEELVVNGSFDTDSDWVKGTGWTISGGSANANVGNDVRLYQSGIGLQVGKTYLLKFDVLNYVSGRVDGFLGYTKNDGFIIAASNGSFEIFITPSNVSQDFVRFHSVGTFIGSIDNVSVKEKLDADFTFTRNSSATRVNELGYIEDVTDDIPRINYEGFTYENGLPIPYSGKGHFLLEGQRTNLITYSEDFSTYDQTLASVSLDNIISPDGNTNSYKLLASSGTGNHIIASDYYTITSGAVVASIFAKKGNINWIRLRLEGTTSGKRAWFDLENGVLGDVDGGGGIGQIVDMGNGWYRCILIDTSNTASTSLSRLQIFPQTENSQTTWTATGNEYLNIFGAQFEDSSNYPTSYIPTNGTAVTRLGETCNNATHSFPSEGVLYAEIAALRQTAPAAEALCISDGTSSNRVMMYYASTNLLVANVTSGGGTIVTYNLSLSDATEFAKVAIRYKDNDYSVFYNGTLVHTDTTGTAPTGLSSLQFDSGAGSSTFYGKTKMVATFPYLSNDEMECLTGEGYGTFEALAAAFSYTIK